MLYQPKPVVLFSIPFACKAFAGRGKHGLARKHPRIPDVTLLREAFDRTAARLGDAVKDLGAHPAGDATALNVRRTLSAAERKREEEQGLAYGKTVRIKRELDLRRSPADSSRHQTVRAALQRAQRRGSGQCPIKKVKGQGRGLSQNRQRDVFTVVFTGTSTQTPRHGIRRDWGIWIWERWRAVGLATRYLRGGFRTVRGVVQEPRNHYGCGMAPSPSRQARST